MTPEERARDLCDALNLTDGDEERIASAIREAEDEALERAAERLSGLIKACEGCEGDPSHPCPMCVAQDEAIDVIRSLKSKEGGR
jgi:hypothetical protein